MTEIRIDVHLPHPPERVWRAIADSKILSEWFLPADLQPVKGARFTIEPNGQVGFDDESIEGEVVDVDAPHRLVMRWRATQLQTVVTLSVRRENDGCRLALDQHGFVGPRGTLRRRVLHRSYAQMFGAPLSAALDRLAEHDRGRAAQAWRRSGPVRTTDGPRRGNESRSFGRRQSEVRFGRRVPRSEAGSDGGSAPPVPTSLARLRRLSIRRALDGQPFGRCAVPSTPDGAGRAHHPGAVVNGLNPNEPTLALPPFPLRPRWAHERRSTPSERARETKQALVTRMRGGTAGRSALGVQSEIPAGRSRSSIAIGLAVIVVIISGALVLDRTMGQASRTARAGVATSPYTVAPGPGSGAAARPSATGVTLSAVYRTGHTSASGYQGIITINNLSSAPLDGWTAVVTLPPSGLIVHDPRGADYQQTGKEVRFTPVRGARVAPGTSMEFSFEVQGVGAPVGCVVNGRPCSGIPG